MDSQMDIKLKAFCHRKEIITEDNTEFKIWDSDNTFMISDSDGWIDGLYDSEETCIFLYQILFKYNKSNKTDIHKRLFRLSNIINPRIGEDRNINKKDLIKEFGDV